MGHRFAELAFTPRVRAAQAAAGSRAHYARLEGGAPYNDVLGDDECAFLEARDSFYIASVGEDGWPYVQHRGGPPGFIRVLDERTIAFADFRGNRQYVTVGHLAGDDRVSLIAVDYPNRRRLKLMGHARVVAADQDPPLVASARVAGYRAVVERAIIIEVAAFDWNCPQHITPRYTAAEIAAAAGGDAE